MRPRRRRRSRGYTTRLEVRSGGAEADLGLVRYWAGTPPVSTDGGLHRVQLGVVQNGEQCVEGVFAGGTEPCMSGEAAVVCTDEDDGDEHECEDGIVPATGEYCDGGPAANGADDGEEGDEIGLDVLQGPVAVPQYSLSEPLGCEEDDEDEDD